MMLKYDSLSVLVVDDHLTMVKIVINLLNGIGFKKITYALNGVEALEKISEQKFDIIVSDWNMPEMDGLTLLKKVRSSEGYLKTIPFIIVTAESKPANILEAKKAGVNNYIIKPFNAATLKKKIDAVLGVF